MSVIGVDPEGEQDFSDFEILVEGRTLEPDDPEAGLIGEELRNGLGAEIGDWVTVLTKLVRRRHQRGRLPGGRRRANGFQGV